MEKIDCNIIRDLLPLYEDSVASAETQELVRAHLADCPACQEELRKLRTPISLPPDEDEEAVKRFLEYRAEVYRKQNRKIIRFVAIAATIVTVLAASLLWYTRPRSWESIAYSGELTRFSAYLHTTGPNNFYDYETYMLEEAEGLEEPGQQIRALLEKATYRVRPWDTLNFRFGRGYSQTGGTGEATIYQIWGQGQQAEYFILLSSGTVLKGHTVYTAKLDGANLYQAIAAIIQEYGTQSE